MSSSALPSENPKWLSLRHELVRKAIHIATALLPVAWSFGAIDGQMVRGLLSVALALAVAVEVLRRISGNVSSVFDRLVGSMLRGHEISGLTGATWLFASMLLAVLVFPAGAAVIALWSVAAGDGAASVAGRLFQHNASRRRLGKTLVGSFVCLAVTAIGSYWLAQAAIGASLVIGGVAALAEYPEIPIDDNLRVAVAAGGAAWILGVA